MIQYIKSQFGLAEMYFVSLFFLITPAIYTTKILDPVLYSRYLALSGFLFLLTIALGFLYYKRRFKFRIGVYDKWVFSFALAYIVWNFISISAAINVKESVFQALKEMALMMSFFYFYQLLRNNSRGREFIIKTVVLMIATFIGIGFVQFFKADFTRFSTADAHYGYYLAQALQGVYSTFSGKNLFPIFLVVSLPFSVYSLVVHEKVWKAISLLNILGALFFILVLAARSAWIGLALFSISVYIFFLYYLFNSSDTFKKRAIGIKSLVIVIPTFLLIVFGIFTITSQNQIAKAVKDKVMLVVSSEYSKSTTVNSDEPNSSETRKIVWKKSFQMAKDHPLLGVGPGQWRIVHPSYGLDEYEDELRQGVKLFQRAHNDLLWIAGETGFVGLFFYLGIYFLILFIAIRNFKKSSDKKVKVFSALAFSGLIAFFMTMMVSFPRERIAINMVYLLIMALILNDAPFKEKSEECDLPAKINYGLLGVLMILFGFNLFVAKQIFDGEKAARMAMYAQKAEKWRLLLKSSFMVEDSFYTLDPLCVPMKYYEGVAYNRIGEPEKAFNAFVEAYKLAPYNLVLLNNLATSYEKKGESEKALEIYQEALDVSPRFKASLMNAAIVYLTLEKPIDALNLLKRMDVEKDKPEKYDIGVVTASKMYAAMIQKSMQREKLLDWYNDENKIKRTFVRFKEGNDDFGQILMTELGAR